RRCHPEPAASPGATPGSGSGRQRSRGRRPSARTAGGSSSQRNSSRVDLEPEVADLVRRVLGDLVGAGSVLDVQDRVAVREGGHRRDHATRQGRDVDVGEIPAADPEPRPVPQLRRGATVAVHGHHHILAGTRHTAADVLHRQREGGAEPLRDDQLDVGVDDGGGLPGHRQEPPAASRARDRLPVRDSISAPCRAEDATRTATRSVVSWATKIDPRYSPVSTGADARAAAATLFARAVRSARMPASFKSDAMPGELRRTRTRAMPQPSTTLARTTKPAAHPVNGCRHVAGRPTTSHVRPRTTTRSPSVMSAGSSRYSTTSVTTASRATSDGSAERESSTPQPWVVSSDVGSDQSAIHSSEYGSWDFWARRRVTDSPWTYTGHACPDSGTH